MFISRYNTPPCLLRSMSERSCLCLNQQLHDDLTTTDFHIYEGNISYSKAGWFDYVRTLCLRCIEGAIGHL
jgi:hypothetical protein